MATAAAAAVKEEPATRFAKDHLKAIVERIERLEEEKKTISDDIRDVYAEAKGTGYDVKALRTIVRLRKQDANARAEQETTREPNTQAVGMRGGAHTKPFVAALTSPHCANLSSSRPCAGTRNHGRLQ